MAVKFMIVKFPRAGYQGSHGYTKQTNKQSKKIKQNKKEMYEHTKESVTIVMYLFCDNRRVAQCERLD